MSLIVACLLGGCAHEAGLAQKSMISTRSDVFREISQENDAAPGVTTLVITASLKTHRPGIYPFDVPTHGNVDYRLVVNIDGQSLQLNGNPQSEDTEQTIARAPEEGVGIRYRFRTFLKISGGRHRVIVALPDDGVAVKSMVTLEEGKENTLRIAPIYGSARSSRKPAMYGGSSFMEGIRGLTEHLNGKPVE